MEASVVLRCNLLYKLAWHKCNSSSSFSCIIATLSPSISPRCTLLLILGFGISFHHAAGSSSRCKVLFSIIRFSCLKVEEERWIRYLWKGAILAFSRKRRLVWIQPWCLTFGTFSTFSQFSLFWTFSSSFCPSHLHSLLHQNQTRLHLFLKSVIFFSILWYKTDHHSFDQVLL